ncbi:chemotaxis protein CheA [Pseudoalteromonas sp. MMG010]|uniref:chemotaxis protein CheA n=1 Tax=Pseudoalteromonas sp. MMG010 TaxID=2822685 RepID=UPI001B3A2D30|nr:chemotaxis protein CheA [Pseudoalteromonas sp. MMG010]
MSIDLSQFHEVFFDESFEGLDAMEAELLQLNPETLNDDAINTIFRAAHSIKGGSSTFSFQAVADITHELESLLDKIRQNVITITPDHITLFLKSIDYIRELLDAYKRKQTPELTQLHRLVNEFKAYNNTVSVSVIASEQSTGQMQTYIIDFKPHPNLFKTGNDPLYIIDDLGELGQLETKAFCEALPEFDAFESDECYLYWQLTLTTEKSKQAIIAVFDWVADDADVHIALQPSNTVINPINALAEQQQPERRSNDATSMRIDVKKVNSLINMTGELVISQNILNQFLNQELTPSSIAKIQQSLAVLAKHTQQLQENILRIRMLPISLVFSRFTRLVRDYCMEHDKQIALKVSGEHTELDKSLIERISDPIVHLVRNSLDHGIESIAQRKANNKPLCGTISLHAFHQGDTMVIEVSDDGQGFDNEKIVASAVKKQLIAPNQQLTEEDILALLFLPGFSTANHITEVSGRGVGMDVVKRNIESLQGTLQVTSAVNEGVKFTIRLPLTLAILEGQLVYCAEQTFVIALTSIIESIQIKQSDITHDSHGRKTIEFRNELIAISYLGELFELTDYTLANDRLLLVVVEADNERLGLIVDSFLDQQQVVVKSVEENYKAIDGIAGATILSNGHVSLIVDIAGLIKLKKQHAHEITQLIAAPI